MPNPYKARVDMRRFLNLPGFHGGAHILAYVEDTSDREITKRDLFGYEGSRYVNPRIILEIADCSERVFVPCQRCGHDIVVHELTPDLGSGRCRRCDCPEFVARDAPRP
jgi:hypothetical protein